MPNNPQTPAQALALMSGSLLVHHLDRIGAMDRIAFAVELDQRAAATTVPALATGLRALAGTLRSPGNGAPPPIPFEKKTPET